MAKWLSECCNCGRSDVTLSLVGGQWWCRNCLFEDTYDFNHALVFTLTNQDEFAEKYPQGFEQLWEMLKKGDVRSFYLTNSEIDEFVSDHLEEYADWVMSNPIIPSLDDICERVRKL